MIQTIQETIYDAVGQHSAIIYAKIISINTNYDSKTITVIINDYIIDSEWKEQSIRYTSRDFSFEEYAGMVQMIKSQVPQFEHLSDTKERELELAIYGYLYVNNNEKPYGATRELTPKVEVVPEEEVLPVE